MSAWALLLVPAALAGVSGLLVLTTWLERHWLSPRALIVGAARARGGRPDEAEALVAKQAELLLGTTQSRYEVRQPGTTAGAGPRPAAS